MEKTNLLHYITNLLSKQLPNFRILSILLSTSVSMTMTATAQSIVYILCMRAMVKTLDLIVILMPYGLTPIKRVLYLEEWMLTGTQCRENTLLFAGPVTNT